MSDQLLTNTFFVSYLVLLGYTGITFIEAIRTPNINIRHIMNLETTISLVASIVYSLFNEKIKASPKVKLEEFTEIRYLDWMITTPLIILALLLFYNQGAATISATAFSLIVILNWGMLGAGYMGEKGTVPRQMGGGVGFAFFAALLLMIWMYCIPKGSNTAAFFAFAGLWTGYGVAYYLDERTKNISYNILDVFSKALFGVGLWLFYGKVLNFSN